MVAGKYRLHGPGALDRFGVRWVPAEHTAIGRSVEVALLDASLPFDGPDARRLAARARVLGRARDLHLQGVMDSGALPDGRPYVVFEALSGSTIGDLVREAGGPLVAARAARIVLQVLEALRALHRAGVVARGLSPESIVVSSREGEEHVKLRDLQAAALVDDPGELPEVPFSPYVAPEIRRGGRGMDPSVDIYSAGALLGHLLTGSPSGARSLGELPDTARRAVARAIVETPDERFPNTDVFMQAVALLMPTDERDARDDMELPADALVADMHYLLMRRSTRHATRGAASGEARAHLVPVLLCIEAIFRLGGQEAWDRILGQVPSIEGLLPGTGNTPAHMQYGVPVRVFAELLRVADDVIGHGDLGVLPQLGELIAGRGLRRLVPDLPAQLVPDALVDGFPYVWSHVQFQGTPSVAERGEREARLVVRGQSEPSLELTSLVASIVRAGLRSIPGTHAEVSLTACAALGDACDVLRVRW